MYTIDDLAGWIQEGKYELLENAIIENPSLANETTEKGISLIQLAAYYRNKPIIELLRKYKSELDIFEATILGEQELVKSELEKNCDLLNSFSIDGFTLLGFACFFGHYELSNYLLQAGANPNVASANPFRVAPLHSACAISNFEIASILIKSGANVNAKQAQGITSLHAAAFSGHAQLAKLLIDNGANVNAKADSEQTPLAIAIEKNHPDIANLLKQFGGEIY